ncbi:MAG: hypothetical protein WBR29_05625 [Gammaproteobacteria bacterium]
MFAKTTSELTVLIAALIAVFMLCAPVMGMGGYGAAQLVKGEIQSIDYSQHAITVNGQIYMVSPQAKFNGIGAFSVLHVGMPVQLLLASNNGSTSMVTASATNNPANTGPPLVVQVTWLPGGT